MLGKGRWLLLVLLAVASGCATTPRVPVLPDQVAAIWNERQARLQTLEAWRLNARVGVRTSQRGGSATLLWQRSPSAQKIELQGPLGGGRVRITVDASGAVLEDTEGKVLRGRDASDLLRRRLGWEVPFDSLASWIRGLPGAEATATEIDDQGLLRQARVEGWQVEILDYRRQGPDLLPRSLRITALPGAVKIYADDGKHLGDELQVKLIVKTWQELVFSG
ncbi:MAG: lipoprotein insertase outer membrane protein LolB [Pseudomonadota bacterium]|nr:lipoprotein insertase outer membrane protein LolB [Pseudomonadota bacterium]